MNADATKTIQSSHKTITPLHRSGGEFSGASRLCAGWNEGPARTLSGRFWPPLESPLDRAGRHRGNRARLPQESGKAVSEVIARDYLSTGTNRPGDADRRNRARLPHRSRGTAR
jgi:hypothetical protein